MDSDLAYRSAGELTSLIRAGAVSTTDVVAHTLARIDEIGSLLNCFTAVWHEEALAAARAADDAVASGAPLGPLHGVPVAVKDTTPVGGRRTTLGSYTHEHSVPERDAYVVAALRRAGAVIVAQTTAPEFAHSLITDSPLWGATRNPWDLTRTTGGSSGGSGAAVASGCVPLAEGTDMGGSVRIPAAWCGVVGLKPGIGRIPMDSLPSLFDNISHHGPLARCVDDARLFLAATQGPDEADIMSLTTPLDLSAPIEGAARGLRLALSVDLGCWAVDRQIEAAVRAAALALQDNGAEVVEVDVAMTAGDEAVWMDLWAVFMAGYYGHLLDEHGHHMDERVVSLITRGTELSAAHVKRLDIERTDLWRRVAPVLGDYDAILCPTMAVAPPAAEKRTWNSTPPPPQDDGRYHAPDMTAVWNLLSPCPALSVPCGWHADGLPIGLQIVGRRWREDTVLRIGRAVELALPEVAARRPPR
jgi:Asp-tRNA(Asn)/Glu-tRNA(Gln) amidotransferase A subunit family amidase